MASADKDLEGLRKELKELSDYSNRAAIIVLTIFAFLVITFSSALKNIHNPETGAKEGANVKETLCKIFRAHQDAGDSCRLRVSYVFGFLVERYSDQQCYNCEYPCASARRGLTNQPPASSDAQPIELPTPCATPTPVETLAEQTRACRCQEQFEANLEDKAKEWFVVEPPVPGIHFKLDLRWWVFMMPVLFSACGVYLFTLRKKQSLLEIVGRERVRGFRPEDVTDLDRLYFDGDRSYLRFPSSLTSFLFVACYLFLPMYLICVSLYVAWSYWDLLSAGAVVTALFLVLVFAFYAVACGVAISNRLEWQVAEVTKVHVPLTRINHLLGSGRKLLAKVALRMKARVSVTAGSLLLLSTLFLIIEGPTGRGIRGFELAQGREKNLTLPVLVGLDKIFFLYAGFVQIAYIVMMLLALFALLAVIFPRVYALLNRKWICIFLLGVAGSFVLFVVVDFSVKLIDDLFDFTFGTFTLIKISALLISCLIWFRLLQFSGKENRNVQWLSVLLVFYSPVFLLMVMFLVKRRALGLMTLLLGASVLLLGFAQIQYRSRLRAKAPAIQ